MGGELPGGHTRGHLIADLGRVRRPCRRGQKGLSAGRLGDAEALVRQTREGLVDPVVVDGRPLLLVQRAGVGRIYRVAGVADVHRQREGAVPLARELEGAIRQLHPSLVRDALVDNGLGLLWGDRAHDLHLRKVIEALLRHRSTPPSRTNELLFQIDRWLLALLCHDGRVALRGEKRRPGGTHLLIVR